MRTVLNSAHDAAGAQFCAYHGWEIPENFGSVEAEYQALRHAAGIVDLSFRGKLVATGEDRARFLQGMLSNDVEQLQPGQGNYCFLLNAQGHILADLNVLVQPERLLLDCEPLVTEKLRMTLERYIIMDEVELEDRSADLGTLAVEGPAALQVVSAALGVEALRLETLPAEPLAHLSPDGKSDFLLVRTALTTVLTGEGFWIVAPTEHLPNFWQKLTRAAGPLGGQPVGLAALEVARIEAGVPRYGADIEERIIPQETGQFRALSFTKGCYVGQEIVERVRSRGRVNRKLVGLVAAAGSVLRAGMKIAAGDRDVGRVTSAAHSFALGKPIALAYLRHEFSEPGSQVEVEGTTAEVAPLPFPGV